MLRVLRLFAFFLLIFAIGRFLYGETINFADRLPDRVVGEAIPVYEYDGFVFPFFSAVTAANGSVGVFAEYYPFEPCCYKYSSGDERLNTLFLAGFYEQDSVEFTLNSIELSGNTTVQILGVRQGVVVDQISVATDGLNIMPLLLALNWPDIDLVVFPGIVGQHTLQLEEITVNEAPVPEPTSIVLLGSGILGLVVAARRKCGIVSYR